MAYRESLTSPSPTDEPITGPDDVSIRHGWWWACLAALALLTLAVARWRWSSLCATAACALAYAIDLRTRRFLVSIEDDAIVLRSRALGWLTVRTRRFDLACDATISDVRDEYDSVGIFMIEPSFLWSSRGWLEDGGFGSAKRLAENRRAFDALCARIDAARLSSAARDIDRHLDPALGELATYWPAIDASTVARNAFGRVKTARTHTDVAHAELGTIPAGSTLSFVPDDRFRSRATRDELTAVRFSAPSDVLAAKADLDDRTTPSLAGATVKLFRFRRTNSSFERRVLVFEGAFAKATVAGRPIRGSAPIESDDGAIARCTLDEPIEIAGRTYESGAEIVFNGSRQCMLTAQQPIEFRGRTVEAPAHVHFALKNPDASGLLRDILRAPDAWLGEPVQVHTTRASA